MDYRILVEKAKEAMENAYAPYSHFSVGAAVLTKDGSYFVGANIENASYGLTNCAERTAIFTAYSQGYRKEDIVAMAVVGKGEKLIQPCGACRQVLSELLEKTTPIVLETKGEIRITRMEELLPFAFGEEDLS